MIGYDRLGTNGRLGNQMFQYASLRGIAANNNNLNFQILDFTKRFMAEFVALMTSD